MYIWLARIVELPSNDTNTYLIQETNKNGTIGCGKITRTLSNDCFECVIHGINTSLLVELEEEVNIEIGMYVKFKGELHAEI